MGSKGQSRATAPISGLSLAADICSFPNLFAFGPKGDIVMSDAVPCCGTIPFLEFSRVSNFEHTLALPCGIIFP